MGFRHFYFRNRSKSKICRLVEFESKCQEVISPCFDSGKNTKEKDPNKLRKSNKLPKYIQEETEKFIQLISETLS